MDFNLIIVYLCISFIGVLLLLEIKRGFESGLDPDEYQRKHPKKTFIYGSCIFLLLIVLWIDSPFGAYIMESNYSNYRNSAIMNISKQMVMEHDKLFSYNTTNDNLTHDSHLPSLVPIIQFYNNKTNNW